MAAGNPPTTCVADFSGRRPFLGAEWQLGLHPQVVFPVGRFTGKVGMNMTWIAGSDPFFAPPAGFPEDSLATLPGRHQFDLRGLVPGAERDLGDRPLRQRDASRPPSQ